MRRARQKSLNQKRAAAPEPAAEPRNAKFKAGAELRARILEAASSLFAEAGHQDVSMRRIAEEAGCSTMAAYYHFSDKDALFQQLCSDLYDEFTTLHHKLDHVTDPRERLRQTMQNFIRLSARNPHHYRLTFLTPPVNEAAQENRVKITKPIISYFRESVRLVLPPGTSEAVAEERLHHMLACLHGMTVMLTTNPRAYGLSLEKACRELDAAFARFLSYSPRRYCAPRPAGMGTAPPAYPR